MVGGPRDVQTLEAALNLTLDPLRKRFQGTADQHLFAASQIGRHGRIRINDNVIMRDPHHQSGLKFGWDFGWHRLCPT
jgi:hypothetical protein